ncbi:MAG: hypothetical protein Q8K11_01975 [Phenylobacterium sp.]|uniref:hypothetical protein n=1 Tax=Phenylobacterium sp. TaxID=1871053 RepID=UPI0027309FCD|nr:hypothetical protein [Phenylobacterium sp.]MDP2008921.1 hypothetical protein [Phenylobacterium sp.]
MITRSHSYSEMTPEKRPQDLTMDGAGLTFETLEHGGEYPDMMPQAIRVADLEGRSCIYVPISVDGKVVDSHGFDVQSGEGWQGIGKAGLWRKAVRR